MLNILKYINIVSGVVKLYQLITKKSIKEVELTRTDKLIDAMDKAVKIRGDMETCGMMILSMIDEEKDESIDDVFKDLGQPDVDFEQMKKFVSDARFKWDKYTDCLLILYGMQLPQDQKDDVIKHAARKPKKKKISKRKLKKIQEKHSGENDEVVNQAGLDALNKLAKDLERVKEMKEQKKKGSKGKNAKNPV